MDLSASRTEETDLFTFFFFILFLGGPDSSAWPSFPKERESSAVSVSALYPAKSCLGAGGRRDCWAPGLEVCPGTVHLRPPCCPHWAQGSLMLCGLKLRVCDLCMPRTGRTGFS